VDAAAAFDFAGAEAAFGYAQRFVNQGATSGVKLRVAPTALVGAVVRILEAPRAWVFGWCGLRVESGGSATAFEMRPASAE
jgi:hypothetical protein